MKYLLGFGLTTSDRSLPVLIYYVNHLLDHQNELNSIESTVITTFSIYFGRDLKKNHSYYIKDYDFITIQTQNMQGIDFSFHLHRNKNSLVDIIAVWIKLCLRQIWRCDLWNRTILSTAKAKKGFFNELYRASQSQRIYCFFSSFLLLGNLQMRADISENQSRRGRKDDFV